MNAVSYNDLINFANFLIGPAIVYAGWVLHDLKNALNRLAQRQELVEKDIIKLQTMHELRQNQRNEDKYEEEKNFTRLEKSVERIATLFEKFIENSKHPPNV